MSVVWITGRVAQGAASMAQRKCFARKGRAGPSGQLQGCCVKNDVKNIRELMVDLHLLSFPVAVWAKPREPPS